MHTVEISEVYPQRISRSLAAKPIFVRPLDCDSKSKARRAVLFFVLAAILIPIRIQNLGWALSPLILLGSSVYLLWFYFKQVGSGLAHAASCRTNGLSGSSARLNREEWPTNSPNVS